MKAWRKTGIRQPQVLWPKWALMSPLLSALFARAGINR